MAPTTQTSLIKFLPRQDDSTSNSTATSTSTSNSSDVPTCVTTCMAEGNTTGCTGVADYTCVCASELYIDSVAACWATSCNATEAAIGQAYSTQACEYYGVNVNSTTDTNTTTSSSNTTASSSDTTSAPVIYNKAFKNIQAAMSSICGALVLLAFVMGYMSFRARYKREQLASQNRTWTGVGTHSMANSKDVKSGFFTRTGNSSAFTNSRNVTVSQTQTFASDNFGLTSSNYGGRESFIGGGGGGGVFSNRMSLDNQANGGERFTNRMPMPMPIGGLRPANESEEWEMEVKTSDSTDKLDDNDQDHEHLKDLESPKSVTTFNTDGNGTEYTVGDSTVHLDALDKGDGPRTL